MKECTKCKIMKDFEAFARRSRNRLHANCRECQKIYNQEHYKRNTLFLRNKSKQSYLKIKDFIDSLKKDKPCADCGVQYNTWQMDFDHLHDKKHDIAHMRSSRFSQEEVLAEAAKCELVCANCHRNRTYQRFKNGRAIQLAMEPSLNLGDPSDGL